MIVVLNSSSGWSRLGATTYRHLEFVHVHRLRWRIAFFIAVVPKGDVDVLSRVDCLQILQLNRIHIQWNLNSFSTSCCSSVVERGIAVSAIILRSVVRPSVAASFLNFCWKPCVVGPQVRAQLAYPHYCWMRAYANIICFWWMPTREDSHACRYHQSLAQVWEMLTLGLCNVLTHNVWRLRDELVNTRHIRASSYILSAENCCKVRR